MVSVNPSRFVFSHGRNPRGSGGWMFENAAREVVFQFHGSFADAKRAAAQFARANDMHEVFVSP